MAGGNFDINVGKKRPGAYVNVAYCCCGYLHTNLCNYRVHQRNRIFEENTYIITGVDIIYHHLCSCFLCIYFICRNSFYVVLLGRSYFRIIHSGYCML